MTEEFIFLLGAGPVLSYFKSSCHSPFEAKYGLPFFNKEKYQDQIALCCPKWWCWT
jgi:hypothetical protein